MKYFSTLLLLLSINLIYSQQFQITGKITDTEGNSLESATIYAEKPADSSLVTYTISEKNGEFSLSGTTEAEVLNFRISYAGFAPYNQSLEIEKSLDLGNITLEIQDNSLAEILVQGTSAPISIKRDTLEFNADSFTTQPNANLEELMKKLPGVEIDSDGEITVNGKPVSRIMVNGEEFFGNDHRIATKNLPKEIIDKIQVTDTKTRSQEFTGEPGDPDNKTVNITIKEDKNQGYFARATAGGGTDERYEMSAIANYFKDDLRISVLGSSNNINSSGFSYDEVFGMMGRSAGRAVFGGGGGGITKSETAGLNFVNKWENELRLTGDYFFGRNDTERRTQVSRENILPNARYFSNSDERSNLINDSHRANARFEIEFDSLTRLSIRPRFNANFGNSNRSRIEESLDEDGNLINNTETFSNEDLESQSFNNDLDFIKRFGARGAYFELEFSNDHSRQRNDNFYYSESLFFEDGEEVVEVQDQYIDEDEKEDSYSLEVSQRSVLADQFFLDVSYDLDYAHSTNKRYVYEAENGDASYNQLNELLSNDFQVTSLRHTPNVGLNYEGEVWRINTDFGLLHTSLENENFIENAAFENTYNNLFLQARVRYEVERSKSITFRYDTDVDIPSINQLQPVIDRTNPLNIRVGNPELVPAYRQSIRADYRNFDFSTRSGIFSSVNISFTDNTVVPVTTIDENLVRTTTYTNVNGVMSANARVYLNKQIKNDEKEFRMGGGLNASYNKNVGFTNAVKYNAERYSISPNLRLTYAIDGLFDINPNYQLTYNSTAYDINPNRNEDFLNHRIGFEATSYWPENVVFGNDISYNYFGNVSPGFENTSLLWNTSLGYQFLDDDATIKIKVYDMLNQNIDTRRTIGDDFIQDTSNLILTQYAMLSFTYKLDKFGGDNPNDRGRNRR
ncbi:TonB-dependent receptor [Salegentibacter salegens]|uniref:Carboxypeptidase regulatory-like domain-containing protein n=1 Tax=Salegentibacter salegens TaxID=143223 RepID=A0A1M7NN60_9FLAO|nr:TonB-dependent receptor [Salegentibacter salegens]PRX43093.1 carboxypeptidase family protein [Salegentibacter salegens]SHN05366.1 Carboxypeptidase regulatory-like domain-containing protein [Salegentibacter salegens]